MKKKLKPIDKPVKVENDISALAEYLGQIQDIKNFSEFPEKDSNPFLCNLNHMLNMGYKTEKNLYGVVRAEMVNNATGEMTPLNAPIKFNRAQVVTKEKFVKIYGNSLQELFRLSYTALQVYGYFISQMIVKKDITEIYFRLQDCMDFAGYKARSTVYDGLAELIQRGFIAKTNRPPSFFINPECAFNGDLIETHNRYILEGSTLEEDIKINKSIPQNSKPIEEW
jgi:hypothetical protein